MPSATKLIVWVPSVLGGSYQGFHPIVVGVADMTGDGKSEILVVEPDSMTINWITSESGYTSFQTRTIGTQRAVIL
ncbi:MAG: hypothetical protein DYH12_15245 [Sorangiineae bacterium PRO1]|nr:hypothetical protein [Sorangiineae bacterium PRO1]